MSFLYSSLHLLTLLKRAGVFLWNEIKYTVKTSEGPRVLLNDLCGWIKPGQMTALMGSSGAGKTTLLDVLAQRKTLVCDVIINHCYC